MPDLVDDRVERSAAKARAFRIAIGAAFAVAAVVIDQVTKAVALERLSTVERIPLIGDLLGLQLAFNPGTVMSLGSSSTWIFTTLAAAALVVVPVLMYRSRSAVSTAGLGLIWGGAAGNFIDRLFAPPGFGIGHVTDFLAYCDLFIGNLADVFLIVGVGLVIIRMLTQVRSDDSDRGREGAHPALDGSN